MSSMFEVIRKIVESEMRKLHIAELGVVTSIFPHSNDSDKDNYECNVKLKYKELELRKVPVATQQIGFANIPHVGDLVLITFVNGDINAPVIIGRLYTDEDRPPVSKEEEIVYIPPYSKESGLRRVHMEFPSGITLSVTDDDVTVEAGKTTLKLNLDGDIEVESSAGINISSTGDLSVTADGNLSLSASKDFSLSAMNIKMESQANMECKASAQAQIEAQAMLSLNGNAGAEIKSPAIVTIQGSLVKIN